MYFRVLCNALLNYLRKKSLFKESKHVFLTKLITVQASQTTTIKNFLNS